MSLTKGRDGLVVDQRTRVLNALALSKRVALCDEASRGSAMVSGQGMRQKLKKNKYVGVGS